MDFPPDRTTCDRPCSGGARSPRPAPRPGLAVADSRSLARCLEACGFRPPSGGFLALAVEVAEGADGPSCRAWDWRGTSRDASWWPASTVKLFAASAALATAARLRLPTGVAVELDEPGGTIRTTLDALVRDALGPSDNAAFDRLAFVAGHASLRRWLVRNGFDDTSLWRGYSGIYRDPATGNGTLARSPALRMGATTAGNRGAGQGITRRGTVDRAPCDVPAHGSRTSLRDLADVLFRIVRRESLGPAGRMGLRRGDARLLREILASPRSRGNGVVDGLREAFGTGARMLHKPGFACDWFSDVAMVDRVGEGPSWIVAMAGRPGRDCLDDASRRIGRLLASGGPG